MPQAIQALFEAIRRECSSDAWSRGVELVRADAVSGDSDASGEIVIRVSERGGLICPAVTLYPEDLDWECDCGSPQAGCAHAAAAVIALRRARQQGAALPGSEQTAGRIGYRFRRCRGGLELDRVVVSRGENENLKTTLAAIASGRVDGPRFLATQTDLVVERILGSRLHGALPRGIIPGSSPPWPTAPTCCSTRCRCGRRASASVCAPGSPTPTGASGSRWNATCGSPR